VSMFNLPKCSWW